MAQCDGNAKHTRTVNGNERDCYMGHMPGVTQYKVDDKGKELDAEATEGLARRLSVLLGKEAIPHVRVRPAILGGVHLKTGDTVYDGTLRRRIKQLRQQLVSAELPEGVFGASES